jgi:site-specific recombinase XerC
MPEPQVPGDWLIDRFAEYLARERCLAADSIRSYTGVARRFLAEVDVEGLTTADVTGFARRECGRRGVASAKATVTGLRALLRFLFLDGQISTPLAGAVPSAACWQLAALPRAVSPADLAGMVESCDRRGVAGRRDYAIIVLLARLGLRAREVAALDLGDIDWRQGEITIRGKGSRRDSLPLPADAGEAVAGWLAGAARSVPPARRCSHGCARRMAGSPRPACWNSPPGRSRGAALQMVTQVPAARDLCLHVVLGTVLASEILQGK